MSCVYNDNYHFYIDRRDIFSTAPYEENTTTGSVVELYAFSSQRSDG